MKKFIFIFFLLLLLVPLKKERLETVFYEENSSFYELDLEKCNMTTNNILSKLDGITIVKIYPYIDKAYTKILKHDLDYYEIKDMEKLDDFIDYYKELLRRVGKNNLANLVNYKGVPISKVIVYDEFSKVSSIVNNLECINILKVV